MESDKPPFDWGILFSMLLCVLLGGGLFLFIRNNALLANGGENLWHPEALTMLGVLGIPLVLVILHVMRSFRRQYK